VNPHEAPKRGPSFKEPPICVGCGILVDPTRPSCGTCSTTYASPPLRARSQPGGGYWVAIKASFSCHGCNFRVPLNHFQRDDGVTCTRCGIEQRFDDSWKELVEFAHSVGDFGTPGHEGRFPDPELRLPEPKPYAALGSGDSWVSGPHASASLGNPLCRACKAPVVVVDDHRGDFGVACSRCNERRQYERAEALRYKLAGIVADEHEAGRREVALVQNRGAAVLTCPNCNAPLVGVKDADGGVTCGHCNVPCRISTRTHALVGHKETPAKTWWFYFDTPCEERRRLLRRGQQAIEHREKLQANNEQKSRWMSRRRSEPETSYLAQPAHVPKAERRALVPVPVVIAVVIVIVAVVGILVWLAPWT